MYEESCNLNDCKNGLSKRTIEFISLPEFLGILEAAFVYCTTYRQEKGLKIVKIKTRRQEKKRIGGLRTKFTIYKSLKGVGNRIIIVSSRICDDLS
jgi:hypothetical protein